MPYDMNMYAAGYGQPNNGPPGQNPSGPGGSTSTLNNGTVPGGMGSMLDALVKGYRAGADKRQQQPPGGPPGAPPGPPMDINGPQGTWPPAGAQGVPFTGSGPLGVSPYAQDPTMAALFSNPPMFGPGSGGALY